MNDARDDLVTGVVVVAAGSGVRLGAGKPKAMVELAGEPLVVHAVRRASAAAGVSQVVVVVPAGREAEFADLLGPDLDVDLVEGGDDRTASVAAGLAALEAQVRVVLVHDAARALAPTELFEQVAAAVLEGYDAVVPGLPVTDTIKQVDARGRVVGTLDRESLRAVQTPQGFTREALSGAHSGGVAATDDAALVEQRGGSVRVIAGDAWAQKVTTRADLDTLERLLHTPGTIGP